MSLRLFALAALTASCSSHFVKGWRGDDTRHRTPQEMCARVEGFSWDGAQCVEDADRNFGLIGDEKECTRTGLAIWANGACISSKDANADQCASIANWSWIEGTGCRTAVEAQCVANPDQAWVKDTCVGKPGLTTSGGALAQAMTAGVALTPIDLKPSNGAAVTLENETCPGFLTISGAQLVSGDAYKLPAEMTSCALDLVAVANGANAAPQHVVVTLERGFYAICMDGGASDDENLAVMRISGALKISDCKEANDALIKQTMIDLSGLELIDVGVLRALKGLSWLDLSYNDVTDLSPLAGLSGLKIVALSHNPSLHDLGPIAGLTGLQKVLLDGTAVLTGRTGATCPTAAGTAAPIAEFCKKP